MYLDSLVKITPSTGLAKSGQIEEFKIIIKFGLPDKLTFQ